MNPTLTDHNWHSTDRWRTEQGARFAPRIVGRWHNAVDWDGRITSRVLNCQCGRQHGLPAPPGRDAPEPVSFRCQCGQQHNPEPAPFSFARWAFKWYALAFGWVAIMILLTVPEAREAVLGWFR